MKRGRCVCLFAVLAVLSLAAPDVVRSQRRGFRAAVIVYGEDAASGEVHAAGELAGDLERVFGFTAEVTPEGRWRESGRSRGPGAALFVVGTAETNSLIKNHVQDGLIKVSGGDPGPEAFVIKSFPGRGEVVIAGCDERGALYGVYEFSERYLGIDPFEYWTGREPEKRDSLVIPEIDVREDPPAFALRGYFDNDSDMLANFSGEKLIIEFELWKQMIDSIARLRYNFIDLFDTMGRPEFWDWPYYTERFPGYHTDLELVNRIMDYAHEKGMMVQVSTYLGYEFHHLDRKDKCLSLHHDDWMEAYRYLIENTPWGKADIFYHSPRDPWWDWPYRCAYETALGINAGKLHTRLINDLYKLIEEHNPEAKLMCLFWSDGKKHWNSGDFKPDPGIDMVWADDGYGRYPEWPEDFRGYNFGIYIHAGFFRNHVMQDPYPGRIRDSILEAYNRKMTGYIFVNGQDFKHFILNLEACARAFQDPEGFDPGEFYMEWAGRYFGPATAPATVESLKALHRASDLAGGFANQSMETGIALDLMKFGIPYCRDYSYVAPAMEEAKKSLELARQAAKLVPKSARLVYGDQILFPAAIYLANLELHSAVAGVIDAQCSILNPVATPGRKLEAIKEIKKHKVKAPKKLGRLLDLLEQGSGWDKWEGWTKVGNFRKYKPPPTMDELERALRL